MNFEVESASTPMRGVDAKGWVDLEEWTGHSVRRTPLAIREPDEPVTHCDSIVAALGDGACDPRSGGVAGTAHLAERFGVEAQQFRKHILPGLDFVRRLGGIPVTNVASLQAGAAEYRERVHRARCERLGV